MYRLTLTRTALRPALASVRPLARGVHATSRVNRTPNPYKEDAKKESHEIDEISGASMAKINQMADAAQSKAGKIASDLKSAFGANAPSEKEVSEGIERAKEMANLTVGTEAGEADDANIGRHKDMAKASEKGMK